MRPIALVVLISLTACSGGQVIATDDDGGTGDRAGDSSSQGNNPGGQDPEIFDMGTPPTTDLATAAPADQGPAPATPDAATSAAPLPYGSCKTPCSGASHLLYNQKYSKWVKVVLCSPARYDIFMGEQQSGPFYKVGDTGGHGQDHCELVNPAFTLTHEDYINSGNCPTCKLWSAGSVQNIPWLWNTPMYWRSKLGDPFTFGTAQKSSIHTSCWYECGVSF